MGERFFLKLSSMASALLPILSEIQRQRGHVPDEAVPAIAAALKLSRGRSIASARYSTTWLRSRTTFATRHSIRTPRSS